MKTKVIKDDNFNAVIDMAVDALNRGELVIMPTETVYGLAVAADRADAFEQIYRAKSRDRGKPVAFLASGIDQVLDSGFSLNMIERRLAEQYWPGPLTLVLKGKNGKNEGFRVPDSPVALALLRRTGGLLRVTSANLSGEPDALNVDAAMSNLAKFVSIAIDAGPVTGGVASSVVKVDDGRLIILRRGAISEDDLISTSEGKNE
ncbi:threonylcarbamoyl-AMP synthase [PVC group bacterium]|nr:threonylcarbamoyl-AMP synthase [PVC group bacterium]